MQQGRIIGYLVVCKRFTAKGFLMGDMDQDDIDKLLADALGGDAGSFSFDDSGNGAQSQDEIDALIAAAASSDDDSGGAFAGSGGQGAEDEDDAGAQSQDDIDALIAAAAGGGDDDLPTDTLENDGPQGQDDIDALIAAAGSGADEDEPEEDMSADDEDDTGGVASQDDIDALIAGAAGDDDEDNGPAGQDDIDALIAGAAEDEDDEGGSFGQDDIDALISGSSSGEEEDEESSPTADDFGGEPVGINSQDDIDALISGAGDEEEMEEEEEFDDELADMAAQAQLLQQTIEPTAAPKSPAPAPAAARPTPKPAAAKTPPAPQFTAATVEIPPLSEAQLANLHDSLSLSGSSGEVENLAGQMSGLLGQLSERARRFQIAWLNADQENRELRHRIVLSEQKFHAVTGEKESLLGEISSLRKQYSRIEGEKLASAEAHRTEIASLELKLREQESRNNMLSSEVRALKEELERARNESTGSDLESRRARFELERLNSELAAEKQERARLARALDNREKELQAMQAQSAGHASTLFLDELHRLVRRLESELDVRTSAAHEALSVVGRMAFTPEQQMYASALRAAVSSACGLTPDEGDALKNLDNQPRHTQAPLNPQPAPGADTFKDALERYDFARASGIASAQMRAGDRTPLDFMAEMYAVGALRRPDIVEHLDDLAAMLRGVKAVQEATDRARGREGDNTEKLFVMIFDLLHGLVRLKLISRANPAIWDLFLELRGRFRFLTSDRQWREYRDKVIAGRVPAAV